MIEFVVFMLGSLAVCVVLVALQYARGGRGHVKPAPHKSGTVEYLRGVEHSFLAATAGTSVVIWEQIPQARTELSRSAAAGNGDAATALAMLNYWAALISKRTAGTPADKENARAEKRKFKDELRSLALRGNARARCAVAAMNGELGEMRFAELYRLFLETEVSPDAPRSVGALDGMIGIAAALGETEYASELAKRHAKYVSQRTVI